MTRPSDSRMRVSTQHCWAILTVVLCLPLLVAANVSCNPGKPGMVNVHLVCHTHDDVGWLKTVDQYYYGARNDIQRAGVQYILDSVVEALQQHPERKFIYVESAFFFRWWEEQTVETQNVVKELVKQGQLEFISGGWSMNDEGAAHYNAIIDQMTLGLEKINSTFGPAARPTIAWQIDPFGHSQEQASLFAQMGFEGLFFGRLDHDDKNTRWANHTMEMVWQASSALGSSSWLFTGVLPNGYGPPSSFCFDIGCNDPPIMDDPRLHDYNVDNRVEEFVKAVEAETKGYVSDHIIMTMGSDFNYQLANSWFKNLDKLIRYVNERQSNGSKVNVFYSTPSCYLDALHRVGRSWPTKTDDFFPYASDSHSYWTGYFTSRPALKGYVRQGNNILQVVKQAAGLAGLWADPRLEQLKEVMGVLQHHDAVSGTAKQHVTDDYAQRMASAITQALHTPSSLYREMQAEALGAEVAETHFCPLLNVSACPATEASDSLVVTVYNPLARTRNHYVRLPVPPHTGYKVTDSLGNAVTAQLVPLPEAVMGVPGRNSSATHELVFLAQALPPLGFLQYHVQATTSRRVLHRQLSSLRTPQRRAGVEKIRNGLELGLDTKTGLLRYIAAGAKMVQVNQTFLWYTGMNGNNTKEDFRASGAYIFRPNGSVPQEVSSKVNVTIVEGPLVMEVHQVWSSWVSQVVRLYTGLHHIEMEWLVGPIPIKDGLGKEVVSRVVTDIDTDNTFYTDANGRQMVKRVKDYRPTWKLNNQEPVAGNYYPVNSRLIVRDTQNTQCAILTDRSQGGTSLSPGQMELMVHRRLLDDDAFGVGEALNETAFGEGLVVRGKHFLLLSSFATPDCDFGCLHRSLGEEVLLQPLLAFTPTTTPAHTWVTTALNKWSGLSQELPPNVHLLTLEPWGPHRLLVRLEHMYEPGESSLSSPATVSLQNLLAGWEVLGAEEMILSANLPKKDLHRYQWNVEANHLGQAATPRPAQDPLTVTLDPMQIRTFILSVQPKSS